MTGTAPATKRLAMLAAIAAVVAPFAAGTTLGAIRFVADDIDPLTITILRLGIGAAVLLPLALVFARGWPRGRDFWIVIGFGVLMFGISQWLVSASLAYTTAARGGILASTVPFMTLAFAVGLRADRLQTCQDASAIPGGWRGDLLMFAASLVLSIYNVATRKVIRRYPPLIFVVCNLLPGALFLGIVGTLTGRVGAASFASVAASENGILAVLYIGIVGSAFTYFLWLWALRHTSPTRVAIGLTMNPVGALVAAAIILDETITLGVWIGLACIAGGILATNWQLQDRSQDKPDGP